MSPHPTLPTADLHVHLEAAISPELLRALAGRAGVVLPDGFGPTGFAWRDLTTFVRDYDVLCSVIRSEEDYAAVAFDALARAAARGAVYVDFIVSPAHGWINDIAYGALVDAVGDAIDRARREHGICGSISLTAVRAPGPLFGPENALRIVADAVAHPHRLVRGFGIAGDTRFDALSAYVPAFRAAKAAGLVTRAHCGEGEGKAGVITALRELEVDILDHATEALWDDALVEEIVRAGRLVTVCPMAHVMVGLVPTLAQHPAWAALRRGLKVALGTDDPVFFRTDIADTYEEARAHAGLDDAALVALTRNAALSGLLPATEAAELSARLAPETRDFGLGEELSRAQRALAHRVRTWSDERAASLLGTLVTLAQSRPPLEVVSAFARGCLLACFEHGIAVVPVARPTPATSPLGLLLEQCALELEADAETQDAVDARGNATALWKAAAAVRAAGRLLG